MTLYDWGWNEKRAREFAREKEEGEGPGRVVRPGRGIHRIVVDTGKNIAEREARLTGKALGRGDTPVAGDWVSWKVAGGTILIGSILPRETAVSRSAAGKASREQVLGANIDLLFVVQALGPGRGFTPRTLERYITMAWESGCRPAVILNKTDLSNNPEADRLDAEASAPGVEIVVCSAVTGSGIEDVRNLWDPGQTGAFIGPSGSGKTSLVNVLAGAELSRIFPVRKGDSKGRHTTTHRELHRLPKGRLLLDTPGLRELQLWGGRESADVTFPEIEEARAGCRFRDCRHENEPGCGVRAALEEGLINPERFESWLELRRELAWLETRRDEKALKEYERKWRSIARMSRQAKDGKEIW